MLTTTLPNGGFTQFIGGDSLERDFPNATVGSYTALINGLDAGNSTVTDWYNAHTAREIVKCFSLCFGEGVERASCSMANDANPNHTLLWPLPDRIVTRDCTPARRTVSQPSLPRTLCSFSATSCTILRARVPLW